MADAANSYILIDSKTRQPVPLPWEAQEADGSPVTVYNAADPNHNGGITAKGILHTSTGLRLPSALGLEFITEADFMAERDDVN